MNYKYFPHTEADIRHMLERIGVNSLDDLYADVPESIILKKDYDLPSSMSETEVRDFFRKLGDKNQSLTIFAGGGAYDHYAPSVIPQLISRSEFLTAYTPYQPEISQGTLQYIFEFQSMISELTGLACTNASMYDGTTAAAEAMLMAVAAGKKKNRVLISETVQPNTLEVVRTYAKFHGVQLDVIPAQDGVTDKAAMEQKLEAGDVAGVIVCSPNKYGIIEDFTGFADAIHAKKGLFIIQAAPSALATKDVDGKRAFVLTLQAREQHIRREKANSNICSNQSLMALYVTIYMALMGKQGLREVNELSYSGAHYLHDGLIATGKFEELYDRPFLKEFTLRSLLPTEAVQQKLLDNGIFGGIEVEEGCLSFCVTEKRTKEEIDQLIAIIKEM